MSDKYKKIPLKMITDHFFLHQLMRKTWNQRTKFCVFVLSKSPSNMKSVLQAGWLLTVAVGNIIVLIIAEAATLEEQVGGSISGTIRTE